MKHSTLLRRLFALCAAAAALLCGLPARAQSAASCPPSVEALTADQVQSGMRDAHDRGFLWRITRDGRSSWLYGTVHAAKRDWIFPGPQVLSAITASDTVALELDMLDPEVSRRIAEGAAAQPKVALPEAMRQRLLRQAEAECVPARALETLSPELQVTTLSTLVGRRDGIDPAYGIDIFLAGFGRGAGKAVVSLETPEQQLEALQMPSAEATLDFVETSLKDLESGRARPHVLRIVQVWADADLDALSHYESWCECLDTVADRAMQARLVDARNPPMADAIAALHGRGKSVFAAVGSLHMVGPMALPGLLAQRGFQVDRVRFSR